MIWRADKETTEEPKNEYGRCMIQVDMKLKRLYKKIFSVPSKSDDTNALGGLAQALKSLSYLWDMLMMMAQVAGNGTLKNLKGPKGLGRETLLQWPPSDGVPDLHCLSRAMKVVMIHLILT